MAATISTMSDAKRQLLERRLRGAGAVSADTTIKPRAPGATVPLSPEQRHVWMHAKLAAELPLYNESVILHRHGALDLAALQQSFDALVQRHEALRTSFDLIDGVVEQIVHPPMPVQLPLTDFSMLPADIAAQEALRVATADVRSALRMERPPLFRARVVRLREDAHQIQLTLHHIIFDGLAAYRVLLPEIAELYARFAGGTGPAPAPPSLQYGDYAIWRDGEASGAAFPESRRYWRQQLAGDLPILDLPLDHARPPEVTYRGRSEFLRFPAGLTESLGALSRAEGVTTYIVLLAAFKALLFRYTGQQDIIVGGITDARRRPELERMLGYFLNPMPLRTRPHVDQSFRAYLREVRETVFGALAASDLPFDDLLRQQHVSRDPARHPLFTTMFSIQPPLVLPDPAWDLTQTDVFSNTAKFDIYLELDERPEGFIARFMYNADLFDASTIQRMGAHYVRVLQGVVSDPDSTLAALPLLDDAERRLIEGDWNETAEPSPHAPLQGLIRDQARRSPDAVAVRDGEVCWSYAELDRQANRLEDAIRRAGAGPGHVVGLCLDRSAHMVAGVLAVLYSGAAYVPLDPALPLGRLQSILDDAAPLLILTERALVPNLPAGLPIVLADAVAEPGSGASLPSGAPESGPDDLALIIFTSGTTGRPKGVELTHRGIVNAVFSVGELLASGPHDVGVAATTLSFDVSCLDLFVPLTRGGQIVMASREVARDPLALAALIAGSGATMMHATPALWRRLVASGWDGGRLGFKAISAGEAMPRDLADALLSKGVRPWNGYGPTETSVLATFHAVGRADGPVPIGRPLGNVTTFIFDQHDQSVPIGVAGELSIGGAGLARGYRNRAELTRARFVTVRGQRLYRTGDLARYLPNGDIVFLGRSDTQVKVRGFRIELEEVEGAILAHPDIASVATVAGPDASGETSIAAYIVGRVAGATPSSTVLRGFLQAVLPDYMIPACFIPLDALPIGSAGKLDRAALPLPQAQIRETGSMPAFTDEWERRVAEIWRRVLRIDGVHRDSDFFDLGGHSILVAMLQARIAGELGLTLSLAELFRAQTVARMASLLRDRSKRQSAQVTGLMPIQPDGSAPPLYWIEPYPSVRLVADQLGPQQPVLGLYLEDRELDGLAETPSVEAIAAALAGTLMQADPVGPYQLIGYCNKAPLAYEIARHLRDAGRTVSVVFNIDGGNPSYCVRPTPLALLSSTLRYRVRRLMKMPPAQMARVAQATIRAALAKRLTARHPPAVTREARLDQMLASALPHYRPTPCDIDMTVIQVEDIPDVVDFREQWRETIKGRLEVRIVPGSHFSLFEPRHIPGLAGAIAPRLLPPRP